MKLKQGNISSSCFFRYPIHSLKSCEAQDKKNPSDENTSFSHSFLSFFRFYLSQRVHIIFVFSRLLGYTHLDKCSWIVVKNNLFTCIHYLAVLLALLCACKLNMYIYIFWVRPKHTYSWYGWYVSQFLLHLSRKVTAGYILPHNGVVTRDTETQIWVNLIFKTASLLILTNDNDIFAFLIRERITHTHTRAPTTTQAFHTTS